MQYERNLGKIGTSLMVVIPFDMVKFLNLKAGDDIIIEEISGSISIKKNPIQTHKEDQISDLPV
jgi:antitoxin component of MazEF toxin-antitoxin module